MTVVIKYHFFDKLEYQMYQLCCQGASVQIITCWPWFVDSDLSIERVSIGLF